MYCFEKINKNPYKYSNLTNLNIKFYHLNYFAVPKKEDNILRSDSNHIPNRYAIVENRFSVPIGKADTKGARSVPPFVSGLPDRIRTDDLQSRSLTRYPAEPRVDIDLLMYCTTNLLKSKAKNDFFPKKNKFF